MIYGLETKQRKKHRYLPTSNLTLSFQRVASTNPELQNHQQIQYMAISSTSTLGTCSTWTTSACFDLFWPGIQRTHFRLFELIFCGLVHSSRQTKSTGFPLMRACTWLPPLMLGQSHIIHLTKGPSDLAPIWLHPFLHLLDYLIAGWWNGIGQWQCIQLFAASGSILIVITIVVWPELRCDATTSTCNDAHLEAATVQLSKCSICFDTLAEWSKVSFTQNLNVFSTAKVFEGTEIISLKYPNSLFAATVLTSSFFILPTSSLLLFPHCRFCRGTEGLNWFLQSHCSRTSWRWTCPVTNKSMPYCQAKYFQWAWNQTHTSWTNTQVLYSVHCINAPFAEGCMFCTEGAEAWFSRGLKKVQIRIRCIQAVVIFALKPWAAPRFWTCVETLPRKLHVNDASQFAASLVRYFVKIE